MGQTGELTVPQILLQYPPLAVLTNAFIKAFNELREFVTYSVMMRCKKILIDAVQATVHSIRKFNVSSHHYHTSSSRRLMSLRRRSSQKRKVKKVEVDTDKPDKEDGAEKEDEKDGDLLDEMEEEIDEVLANLVKVECEYLLPFLCDVFDLMFERRKEIDIDDLLEYFVGLYSVPEFVTTSDHEDEAKVENEEIQESKTESKTRTETGSHEEDTNLIDNTMHEATS